ncbi:MAG: hypothetical protein PHI59_01660 [Candidatus Omnitrophica bacterium]|nr:hypothetical protein [Candidatus Omnitrophota bacterium]
MSKILLNLFIIAFLVFSGTEQLPFIATADTLYKIIDSTKSESSRKIMYTNSISIDANITASDLRSLLNKTVKEFGDRIINYKRPTKQSVVYAYLSEEAYRGDKGSWVGMAFWIMGKGSAEINIREDKLKSAHQGQIEQARKEESYAGVYGPDGNYRTKAILPLEKQVYDALKKEFDSTPELPLNKFTSDDAWINACDAVDAQCIKKVAKDFKLSEKTVKDIWSKVSALKY